jgi:hypothetical protein
MFGQTSTQHNPSEWRELLWKGAGCSVLLPHNSDSPEYLDSEIRLPRQTREIAGHRIVGYEGDTMYSIDYYDLPLSVSKNYLEYARKEGLAASNGRSTYRAISLDGNPGVEFKLQSGRHFALTRRYVVKQRLFLLAITKLERGPAPKNVDVFLNSFKLVTN